MPLRLISVLFSALIFSQNALAKEAIVFDVRRPTPMVNGEVLPQDFFINVGSEDGIKVDMVITVNRRQTMYDAYTNKSPGDLVVAVGQIRIIHVQPGLSVARIEKIFDRSQLPTLDFEGIMVGDRLDMGSAKVAPRKTAALQLEVLQTTPSESASFSSQAEPAMPAAPSIQNAQPM